jgi:flagellar motor component MotA
VLGCMPVLVVAGMIEAFVSPTELAASLKFALAATLFVVLAAYLLWSPARPATADSAA